MEPQIQEQKAFTADEHFPPEPQLEKNQKKVQKKSTKWYKRPRYWVVFVIAVVILIVVVSSGGGKKVEYISEKVEKKNLVQTVSATGTVESDIERDLHFEKSGVIDKIFVAVGDMVKEGDTLAKLDTTDFDIQLREAESALSVAKANLNIVLAGSTSQAISVSRENVNKAQTSYDNAVRDHSALLKKLETDVVDAQTTLSDTKNSQETAVENARQNIITKIGTALTSADQALDDADIVLDDQLLGSTFSIQNPQYENNARIGYDDAIVKVTIAQNSLLTLKADKSESNISAAIALTQTALDRVQYALDNVFAALGASISNSNFTDAQLTVYKSNIIVEQNNVNAAIASVDSVDQAYKNAKLTQTSSVNSAQTALNTILSSKDVQIASSQARIDSALASLQIAKAQLNQVQAGPRGVDISLYQSQVEQAEAQVDLLKNQANDYFLFAPKDGTITFVNYKEGEIPSNVGSQTGRIQPVISLVGEEQFEIEVDIPESDIIKIELNDAAAITLDAYSEEVKFNGTVKSIDIADTLIQDVVYYKVTVGLDPAEVVIKSGMTANVDIITDRRANAVVIPRRAVVEKDGRRFVRLLIDGDPVEAEVTLGISGDDGEVEILMGLEVGDEVIIFEKTSQ